MAAQLQRREIDFRAETLKKRRHGQVERHTALVPGKYLCDARDVNLLACTLASGQDNDRGGMGQYLTKAQPECQVITPEDNDLPLASLLVHDGAPPQQTRLAHEPVRINGDSHASVSGTRAQPISEDIYRCACWHASLA